MVIYHAAFYIKTTILFITKNLCKLIYSFDIYFKKYKEMPFIVKIMILIKYKLYTTHFMTAWQALTEKISDPAIRAPSTRQFGIELPICSIYIFEKPVISLLVTALSNFIKPYIYFPRSQKPVTGLCIQPTLSEVWIASVKHVHKSLSFLQI